MSENPTRIVWAVDAFIEDRALYARMGKAIRAWCEKGRLAAVIEPVSVLSPDQLKVTESIFASLSTDLRELARQSLDKALGKVALPGLVAPTFLVTPDHSLRSGVRELIAYARGVGASLIVAGTHSRKGVRRLVFGSFAETLVLLSEVPVLILNPKAQAHAAFRHFLFPTDLTDRSHDVFAKVIVTAAQHRAKITLFHKMEYVTEYTLGTLEGVPAYQSYLKEDLERKRAVAQTWVTEANAQGVTAAAVMDAKAANVADAVLAAARRLRCDVIAMASQTGPVVSALLGSVTRQVLRASPLPVWVVHPRA